MEPNSEIQFVKALYQAPDGRHGESTLYSSLIDPKTRRKLLISASADTGDFVDVPVQDVIANPSVFLAPCGRPFGIVGVTLIDPCLAELPVDPEEPDNGLEAMEPATDEELNKFYYLFDNWEEARTAARVYSNVDELKNAPDDELSKIFSESALKKIQRSRRKVRGRRKPDKTGS